MSAPAAEPVGLALRGLVVELGRGEERRRALGPLDLDVRAGEHLLVAGRSGAGKTTLLRVIAGLVRASAGTVAIGGRVVEGSGRPVPPQERGVGMLFQGGALWPHMSVARTLAFVLARRGIPRAERPRRAAELVELCELAGLERRRPAELSGGEAQRLALARALAMQPRVLLLDEPLGALDQELRATLLARLAEAHRRLALTTLHVTHAPAEALAVADRVLRLADGRLLEDEQAEASTASGSEWRGGPRAREVAP